MKKRTVKAFKSWEEAEADELASARATTPEERMKILYDLIELYDQLPRAVEEEEVGYIERRKKP